MIQHNTQSAPSDAHLQQLADAIAQRDALQQLLQQREGELLAAHEQASVAAAQAAALQQQVEESEALRADNAALKQQVEESEALRADNAVLKQQVEESEAQASELDDTNTRLEAQLAALQAQAADVQEAQALQDQVRYIQAGRTAVLFQVHFEARLLLDAVIYCFASFTFGSPLYLPFFLFFTFRSLPFSLSPLFALSAFRFIPNQHTAIVCCQTCPSSKSPLPPPIVHPRCITLRRLQRSKPCRQQPRHCTKLRRKVAPLPHRSRCVFRGLLLHEGP